MINQEKIAFIDVDGVLADFVSSARIYSRENFGKELNPDAWLEQSLAEDEVKEILTNEDFFADLAPYEDASEALHKIKEMGYYIIIVTARNLIGAITFKWLLKHNIPFDLFQMWDDDERVEEAKKMNPVFCIDDTFKNALSMASYCQYSFLRIHEWNAFYNNNVVHIYSLMDIIPCLERIDKCQD